MFEYAASRLKYLRHEYTRGQIQQLTGIHWKTQEAVLEGRRDLLGFEKQNLASTYGKEVYSNLKDLGMSASQATRFRSYATQTVYDIEIEFSGLVSDLTTGASSVRIANLIEQGKPYDYDDIYNDMNETIKRSLSYSNKSYEEWFDYLSAYEV